MSERQELVDPRYGVTMGEAVERRGRPDVRVDAGKLAVLDERGCRPSLQGWKDPAGCLAGYKSALADRAAGDRQA